MKIDDAIKIGLSFKYIGDHTHPISTDKGLTIGDTSTACHIMALYIDEIHKEIYGKKGE